MTRPATKEEKSKWKEKIEKQKTSNLSIEAYCRENQIASHRFYYWRNRLFNDVKSSSFCELIEEKRKTISIQYHGMYVHLDQDFDSIILKKFIEVVKKIEC